MMTSVTENENFSCENFWIFEQIIVCNPNSVQICEKIDVFLTMRMSLRENESKQLIVEYEYLQVYSCVGDGAPTWFSYASCNRRSY